MATTEVFYVVNDNPKTVNPQTGKRFDGIWCYRNGYQTKTFKEATPYFTRKGAQTLIDKLIKDEGMTCPDWARVAKNTKARLGKYRIVSGIIQVDLLSN
jgi:hypothetical protein